MFLVGIKEWFEKHFHPEEEDPVVEFDRELEEQKRNAERAKEVAEQQRAAIEKLRPKSTRVHRGLSIVREDNHFSEWLFRTPPLKGN